MTQEQKSDELKEIIQHLCKQDYLKDEKNVYNTFKNLATIYEGEYRHSYSDIFNTLQQVFDDDFEVSSILGENLNVLEEFIGNQLEYDSNNLGLKNVAKKFSKLADHIRLEIGRYNFFQKRFAETTDNMEVLPKQNCASEEQVNSLRKEVSDTKTSIEKVKDVAIKAQKALDQVDEKLERNKVSSITVITIFSAVVLAFSGGISFEAGVFSGIDASSRYRLIFIVALTGFILFNTIFMLLYLVSRLTDKTISISCKHKLSEKDARPMCNVCGGKCLKEYSTGSVFCRAWHGYPYVMAINVILLLLLYEDYSFWASFTENRYYAPSMSPLYSAKSLARIFAPLLLGVILAVLFFYWKSIQNKRIIISLETSLLNKYLYPVEELVPMQNFLLAFRRAFQSQTREERIEKDSTKLIAEYVQSYPNQKRKLHKKLKCFVKGNMLTKETLAQTISLTKSKENKLKLKRLLNEVLAHS